MVKLGRIENKDGARESGSGEGECPGEGGLGKVTVEGRPEGSEKWVMRGCRGNSFLLKKQQLCPEWEHARMLGIFLRDTLSPAGHYQIFFITVLPQFMIVYFFKDDTQ